MKRIIRETVPLVISIAVLSTSLYVVVRNLPPIVRSFRFFWGPAVLVLIFLTQSSAFGKKPMRILILYGAVSLGLLQYTLWEHMSDWNRLQLLDEFYSLIVFSAIFFYYYVRRDFKGLAKLGKLSFFFIVITIIMTNIALFFDPMVIRQSTFLDGFTPFQAQIYKITGAGGYSCMQSLVCLIPVLVYYIKYRTQMIFSRKILIVILLLIMITMIRAQVFANLLAAVAITILSFAGAKKAWKSFVLVTLVIILFLAIPSSLYADMLIAISSYFDPDSHIYYKLNDFAFFIRYPEFVGITGAGGRAERYPLLFEAFMAAPLLGDASYNSSFTNIAVGGHLYWMNKLTIWGIGGFLFFVFVLSQIYKSIRSLFDNTFGFYYFLSVTAFILLGLMKNIVGREPFLMLIVVIPGLYFLPLLEQKEKSK